MPKRPLRGKVVIVTGASAGVGRAAALEFARHGAKLGLISRNGKRLQTLRDQIRSMGTEAEYQAADVADANAVEEAARLLEWNLGPIDFWVNNAMVSVFSPVHEMTPEEFRRVTEVTYLGYVHGTLSALRRMRSRNQGLILQVGSALAYRSIPLQSAYCAAKHAISGFTESLRTELLHERSGVQVVQVQLPAINTPQFSWVMSRLPRKPQPVPPIFQPEVAARAIVWAAQRPKREYVLGFPALKALLAEKFVPWLGDLYLAWKGYDSQQTSEPDTRARPVNLWKSPEGDFGAHGEFDEKSRDFSVQFWLSRHRTLLLGGLVAGAGSVAALARKGKG